MVQEVTLRERFGPISPDDGVNFGGVNFGLRPRAPFHAPCRPFAFRAKMFSTSTNVENAMAA